MFVSDKLIFLELQKTGCSHIRKILCSLIDGQLEGKHNQASAYLFDGNRIFVGSVRCPWSWYLSLWSYGCNQKGTLFKRLTTPLKLQIRGIGLRQIPLATLGAVRSISSKNFEDWKRVYRDANDISAFRDWLHMMYDNKYRYDLGENFGPLPIHNFAGFLSYRFVKIFCLKADSSMKFQHLSTFDELEAYASSNCFIDYFIRNEELVSDLMKVLDYSGVSVANQRRTEILNLSRTNTSSRDKALSDYYDRETVDMVFENERLIVNKFQYSPPNV
jgi:hypothetical protein